MLRIALVLVLVLAVAGCGGAKNTVVNTKTGKPAAGKRPRGCEGLHRASQTLLTALQPALSQLQLAKGGSAVAAKAKRADAVLARYRPQIAAAKAPNHLLRLDKRRLLGDIDGLRRKLQPLESGTHASSKSMTEAEQLTEIVGDIGLKCEPS